MILTREQEEQLLRQYKSYLSKQVANFLKGRKCENPVLNTEDLMQVAYEWFLKTIREEGLQAALRKRRMLHHVLYETVRNSYPMYVPYYVFRQKRDVQFHSLDSIEASPDSGPCHSRNFEEWITENIMIERFMGALSDRERTIVDMKLAGYRIKEIAEHLDINVRTVNNAFHVIRDKCTYYLKNKAA